MLLHQYARLVAQQILDEKIDAAYACHILYHVYQRLDYLQELWVWYVFNDAWFDITHGYESYHDPQITKDSFANLVKEEARRLLAGELSD